MFELKRKLHYNEFQAVQLAKRLMAEEEDDDDDDDSHAQTAGRSHHEPTGANTVPTDTSNIALDEHPSINN